MNITCRHFYSGDDCFIFEGGWVIEEKKSPTVIFMEKNSWKKIPPLNIFHTV